MQGCKKNIIVFCLLIFVSMGIMATHPPEEEQFTNLKVLPKKVTGVQMESIMYILDRQLGVNCLYCHVPKKNVFPKRMDFASDENPKKKIAREMLRMTIKINIKYFGLENKFQAIITPKMWCRTCHRGFPVPPVK
jgi:thioredoxin-related protein